MKILIIYHTKTGHTQEAITPMIEGLKAKGTKVDVSLAKDFNGSMLSDYDALIVGTPCWAGSSGIAGVASPVIKAIKSIPENELQGKLCGGVAVHAKYGGESTLRHLEKLLSQKGCESLLTAPVVKAGTLMSILKGPSVTKEAEEELRKFGEGFASQLLN
ncbi:flavodoxin family protein [Saccharicrinis aurantiacus]|uniref:flavodoxin family protein n=1 Tax=Saccharicrinis aurantiacus TaxID=1849719 RepID=UPI0008384D02|nr:flavodoxin domain-containing protein [Saccharicrinis aurantiacus]